MAISGDLRQALQRVAKWRSVLAGWHLGTQAKTTPGVQAMRDLRELTLILRMELNAVTGLLIAKGAFTSQEWDAAMVAEVERTEQDMAERFPGIRAVDAGMYFYDPLEARRTMARLGFPE